MVALRQEYEPVEIDKLQSDLIDKYEQAVQDAAENSGYFESTIRPKAIGLAAPPELQKLAPNIGYPRLYVLALAERITVEGFKIPGEDETESEFWTWWTANRLDTEFTLGCVEALVHGAAYITISAPPEDENALFGVPDTPIIQIESPLALYADVDPWTRQVRSAIRVFKDNEDDINRVTIYTPEETIYREKQDGGWVDVNSVQHNLGVVPVVPLLNRRKLSDFAGSSEITPELKSFTDAAGRLLTNMQAAAELMAVPQRVIFGMDPKDLIGPDGQMASTFDAYMARILAVADPQGKVDQFQAAQLQNFADGIREIRNEVAAYTGLPPQYLSNSQDNPASADAIRSAERRLVANAERKCAVFGGDLEEAMRVAYKVMNNGADIPPEMYRLQAIFRNPATPTYEAKADAASKLYANGMGVIPKEQARIDIGYSPEQRLQMRQWDEDEQDELMARYEEAQAMTAEDGTGKAAEDEPDAVPGGASGPSAPNSPPK